MLTFYLALLFMGDARAQSVASVCNNESEMYLSIQPRAQETPSWCWVASAQMAMDTFGTFIDQCNQVDDVYWRNLPVSCCINPWQNACNKGGWPRFDYYDFNSRIIVSPRVIDWIGLTGQICQKRPVLVAVKWKQGGSHMFVVFGYKVEDNGEQSVFYIDPCMSNDESSGQCVAGTGRIPFDRFIHDPADDYIHWVDYIEIFRLP